MSETAPPPAPTEAKKKLPKLLDKVQHIGLDGVVRPGMISAILSDGTVSIAVLGTLPGDEAADLWVAVRYGAKEESVPGTWDWL